MTLDDLLQKLSYGHLSELAIGGEGSGLVPEQHIPKIVLPANEVLLQLYTRFPLKLSSVALLQSADLQQYHLHPDYALSSTSTQPVKYIQDSVEVPFTNDILQVLDILDHCYEPLPLNDRNDKTSWHLLTPSLLKVHCPVADEIVHVCYKARHAELPLVPAVPCEVEIELPQALEAAALAFIAGTVYSRMTAADSVAKGQLLLQNFENVCLFHEMHNTFHQYTDTTNLKPQLRGWA